MSEGGWTLPRMTTAEASIDLVLTSFFRAERKGAVGLRRGRIELVEAQLRAFLEREGPHHVCSEHRLVLFLEREFGTLNPVARFLRADALLLLLRPFVERAWLPGEAEQRCEQLRLVDALARYLDEHRLFDRHEIVDRRSLGVHLSELRRSLRAARAALASPS